jgi:hypothetical protein
LLSSIIGSGDTAVKKESPENGGHALEDISRAEPYSGE